MAKIAETQYQTRRAIRHYQAAAATVERVQRGLTITLRPGFLEDKGEASRKLIAQYLKRGQAEQAFDALERAKSTDPAALREALRKTNFKDHPMVGGPVVFDEKGDNINATTALIQVLPDKDLDDRVKVVLPKEFAVAPYVFPWKQLWDRG